MLAMYGFHLDFFFKLLQTIYYKVRVCKLCIFTFLKNVSLFLRSFFQKSLSLCSNLYTKQICKYLYQIVQTIYIKTAISNHFLPYKKCVTEKRKYVNKEYNLLNPYSGLHNKRGALITVYSNHSIIRPGRLSTQLCT